MAEKSSTFQVHFDASNRTNAKISLKGIKFLLSDMKKYFLKIFAVLLLAAGNAFTFVLIPEYLGKVIDIFVSVIISSVIKGVSDIDWTVLGEVIVPTVVVFVANTLFSLSCDMLVCNITSSYAHGMRKRLFEKILGMDISFADIHSKKYVYELSTGQIDVINQSLNLVLSQELNAVFCVTAVIYKIFTIDIIFGITALLIIPLGALVQLIISQVKEITDKDTVYENIPEISELYGHFTDVRLSGEKERIIECIEKNENLKSKYLARERFFDALKQNPSGCICSCFITLVILSGAEKVASDAITLGVLISVVIFFLRLSKPLSQVSSFSSAFINLSVAAESVAAFAECPDENGGNDLCTENISESSVEFRNVRFRYPDGIVNIFEDFSFSIKNRGITVISGETGAGKTTLLKLMTGFYVPDDGIVSYNGRNITDFCVSRYRNKFSVIPQEATLFEISLKDNIVYPDKEVDEKRLEEVFSCVNAELFFGERLNVEETVFCANPKNISDGQIQFILLCRALYHKKEFIILDEALSSMDNILETEIYSVIKKLSADHGIIIISHRKENLPEADSVIEVCEGRGL